MAFAICSFVFDSFNLILFILASSYFIYFYCLATSSLNSFISVLKICFYGGNFFIMIIF